MWKKLLVPHDFSPCAARALTTAVQLAKIHASEIMLVHVSELPPNLSPETLVTPAGAREPIRTDEYLTHGAREQLEVLAAPLRQEGLAVRTLAVTGAVAEGILSAAADLDVGAIVVGTHGRKGLAHLLLGSVAEKIMRGATVPVVSVRTRAPETNPTAEESNVQDELAG